MADFFTVIRERSSTRSFTEEKLTEEELETVLTAGMQAPTAKNLQEIFFSVTDGADPLLEEIEEEKLKLREQVRGEHNFCYEAQTVIFLSAEEEERWSKVDAGIAVQSMALAAEALGLGSLIIGSVYDALRGEKEEYFREKLRIPAGKRFQIAIGIGHKAAERKPHEYDREKHVARIGMSGI